MLGGRTEASQSKDSTREMSWNCLDTLEAQPEQSAKRQPRTDQAQTVLLDGMNLKRGVRLYTGRFARAIDQLARSTTRLTSS